MTPWARIRPTAAGPSRRLVSSPALAIDFTASRRGLESRGRRTPRPARRQGEAFHRHRGSRPRSSSGHDSDTFLQPGALDSGNARIGCGTDIPASGLASGRAGVARAWRWRRAPRLSSVTNFRPPCVTKSDPPLEPFPLVLFGLDRINRPSSRAVETVGIAERFPSRLRAASASTASPHASVS